jgi:hypothetical protein
MTDARLPLIQVTTLTTVKRGWKETEIFYVLDKRCSIPTRIFCDSVEACTSYSEITEFILYKHFE